MIPWLGRLARSFGCAFAGLFWMVRSQRNARIHLMALGIVVVMGAWLRITSMEWCLVVLAAGGVLAAEALNSAVEELADRLTTERDERIRRAKDAAAAGVLLAALAALAVGLMVFLPRLLDLVL